MKTTIAKTQNGNPSVSFSNVVDNIFQSSLRRFFDDNFWETDAPIATGTTPVNVRDTEQQYEIDVIAPGCNKEDFNIRVDDNVLMISSSFKEEHTDKNEQKGWMRNEYIRRSFSRSFTLDETVDVNKINADYSNGILHLRLPKNEKAKKITRNIDIS